MQLRPMERRAQKPSGSIQGNCHHYAISGGRELPRHVPPHEDIPATATKRLRRQDRADHRPPCHAIRPGRVDKPHPFTRCCAGALEVATWLDLPAYKREIIRGAPFAAANCARSAVRRNSGNMGILAGSIKPISAISCSPWVVLDRSIAV